ncbi:MAG: hypothetical protein J2P38_01470, partial [Candidatus Dormibacteraeota bacterium]|nr:hypothetical protein [Candidatus Dormibacteraeota bacterium]
MGRLTLGDERIAVQVDRGTGALCGLEHRPAGLRLIADPDLAARHPFAVVLQSGEVLRSFDECFVERHDDGGGATVRWTLDGALTVTADLRVEAGSLLCRPALRNPSGLPVAALAYPYVAGIGGLGAEGGHDELVHPYATGFLVRD